MVKEAHKIERNHWKDVVLRCDSLENFLVVTATLQFGKCKTLKKKGMQTKWGSPPGNSKIICLARSGKAESVYTYRHTGVKSEPVRLHPCNSNGLVILYKDHFERAIPVVLFFRSKYLISHNMVVVWDHLVEVTELPWFPEKNKKARSSFQKLAVSNQLPYGYVWMNKKHFNVHLPILNLVFCTKYSKPTSMSSFAEINLDKFQIRN